MLRLGFGIGIPTYRGSSGPTVVRLLAPTGLILVEDPGNGQIDLSWDNVVGATGFEYKTSANLIWTDLGNVNELLNLDVGLTSGVFYLRAYDSNKGRSTTALWDMIPVEPGAGFTFDSTAITFDSTAYTFDQT